MQQNIVNALRGYRQTAETIRRLLLYRQMAFHKLTGIPVNLAAYLLNRPPPCPPPVLQLDITDMCNLKCPGCLTGMGYNRGRQGMMSFEVFQTLIDEAARSTALVVLYNSGEPLLHPDAPKMIRYLSQNRIASIISTNGHFINSRRQAEALVEAGLSVMVVSLSGATQATYERYHRGGRLGQVLEGVRLIRDARARLQRRTPIIIFRFLIMDHNINETAAMKSLAKNAGCDWFEFRKVNWQARLVERPSDISGHGMGPPNRERPGRCLWPWLISVVNWNGDVYPCCFYRLNLPDMGNTITGKGIKSIWKNKAYNLFRRKMRTGRNRPAACLECPAETGFQTRFSRQDRTVYVYPRSTGTTPDR